ncbi:MAG: hypothetical protein PHX08_15750 [Lachnospiraceae bacterium]|nr:hypothetical protein [Lachnospiraceae bacterium]
MGNITADDASQLRELTLQLYNHVYSHYEELGGYAVMKPLLEGAIKEAAATMYVMSADEKIRMQCEARERYEYERKAAMDCGLKLGEERLAKLINHLISDGCQEKIIKVTTDKKYRDELYKKYDI